MKIINMVCPNCGATLQIDAHKKHLKCNYCGNNLFIDDGVQHIQYDNAEEAGYQFEKGRQRAQAESKIMPNKQQATINPNRSAKKNNIWLWVLGWIFIFPIPLTILLLRNKDLNKNIKYGIIAAAWIIYLIFILAYSKSDNNSKNQGKQNNNSSVVEETTVNNHTTTTFQREEDGSKESSLATESQQITLDGTSTSEKNEVVTSTKENTINTLIEKYNATSDNKLVFAEDFVVSSKDSGHYRTEFRLGAYKDAVGKSYKLNEQTVDFVVTEGSFTGKIDVRIYSDGVTLEQCIELIRYASPLLDANLSNEDIEEVIKYVSERKEANGYSYGELGLLLLGNDTKGYELMISTD